MIIKVVELTCQSKLPCRYKYLRFFEPANEKARIVISLIRRPLLEEQDLIYLKKLHLEAEIVTSHER